MPSGILKINLDEAARVSGGRLPAIRSWLLLGVCGLALSGCVGSLAPEPKKQVSGAKTFEELKTAPINDRTKFSSSDYGVEASERVTTELRPRKGGGRFQIGKPYKIKGRWYHPKHDVNLREKGLASWYGPNFHGRLTANGEIYDQFALTAAHPTMPLPSYARVTNLENGRKITVRVNDRGPFAPGRVIDLSARAAKLLGYDKQGLAKVKVEYAGEAPLHGKDEHILLASYIGPSGADTGAPAIPSYDPSGIPTNGAGSGTMIALADTDQPAGPVAAIEDGFGSTELGFVTSNSVVPTPRPTLFEGIALDDGEAVVFRAAPVQSDGLAPAALSFTDDGLSSTIGSYQEIRVDNPWAEPGKVQTIALGTLTNEAVTIVRLLLGDLKAGLREDGTATLLKIDEAHVNTALERLRQSGLTTARIL